MIKIYLDTNIYSKLKLPENKEFLDSLIFHADREAMFCYSQAHLNDLHQDKSEKKFADLEAIDSLCRDNFLHYDSNKDSIVPLLVRPVEAYDEYKPDDLTLGSWVQDFLNSKDSEDEILNALRLLWQYQEIDLNLDRYPQNRTPEAIDMLTRFGITKSKFNMLEWIGVVSQMIENFQTDDRLVRDIRRLSQEHLQTQKFKINIDEVDFNQRVEKTPLGKSFVKFLEEQLDNSKPKDGEVSFFQRFTTAYSLINLFGFDSEKNKKVKFMNTQHDGQHAYYAITCDMIVSDDEGLRQKSRFLYNLFGIQTNVYSFEEFKRQTFLLFKNEILSIESFLEVLKHDLTHGLIVSNDKTSIKHQQITRTIKFNHYYFCHFDRISIARMFEDGAYYILLYKNKDQIFFKDFCSVTNIVSKIFGLDNNLMGKFKDNEMEEVIAGVWAGREWTFETIIIQLLANSESKRINLVIGPLYF